MIDGKKIGAVLLMGGEGRRFGSSTPKQFVLLGEKKVYLHTLETVRESGLFDEIVLVCHADWTEEVRREVPFSMVVSGGRTRQESSLRGLKSICKRPDIVLIHDAVRPFVTVEVLRENVRVALEHGAVDTCIPSADTLVYAPGGKEIASIPRREDYLRGQTPQTFRFDWILEAHEKALQEGVENASDDCKLVLNLGRPIQVVRGHEQNLKITTELDLFMAEQLLNLGKVAPLR